MLLFSLDGKMVKLGKYMQFAQIKPQLLSKAIYHCTWNSDHIKQGTRKHAPHSNLAD
jgi:hypothetical protein